MSEKSQQSETFLRWFRALVVVFIIGAIGLFVYHNATVENASHPFKLGLDLAGAQIHERCFAGTRLV